MLKGKKALLLDMNGTFMFAEDRFGESEDFSVYYHGIGGELPKDEVNEIIRSAYEFLDQRYPDEEYRNCFPSVEDAIDNTVCGALDRQEKEKIIATFAHHEKGIVPEGYVRALKQMRRHFVLALVVDIWSPKRAWLREFEVLGISGLFSASSFSSDHGMVKPSPEPFNLVLDQLGVSKSEALVIGDSPRRDLGGARAAGIDCVLVGGARHPDSVGNYQDLLEFCHAL